MRYMSVARERPPAERIVRPFQDFTDKQSSGGIILIVATVIALAWANSPWAESYAALWHTKLSVGVGDLSLSKDLTHWVNDGLMAVFFLVVGLEIKREILVGELSSARNAALSVAAALGGAIVPALIYLAINAGPRALRAGGYPWPPT
jgi:NhaA family Na+:H+ antiporter